MDFTTYTRRFSNPWMALVLITITATIIYSNIYNAPFVFDDIPQIVENEQVKDLSHYSSPGQILKDRNIVYLTFAINYKLSGLNVIGYHITNILIHIVNGFLVYFLALIIFGKLNKTSRQPVPAKMTPDGKNTGQAIGLMSLIAALIFVAHPIQTQAVTYTVQRMASMAAMFYLASVFFYLKARIITESRLPGHAVWTGRAGYLLSGLCGVLALLSKQSAASLPGAILLVEFLFINRTWHVWKKMIPWFVFSFAFWSVFVSYILGFLGVFSSGSGSGNLLEEISDLSRIDQVTVSCWQYICTQFNVLVIYIRLLFLPVNQCLDYLYPYKNGFLDGYTPIAFSFLIGLVGIGVWSIKKRPMISLAVFWFFITLSVESSVIPLYAYFEHRLYLPMFGFAVFASWLLFHFLSTDHNPRRQSWVIVIYAVIITSLGTATYHRNGVWQDEIKLWSDCVSKSPQSHKAHNNLGEALLQQDRSEDALFHLKEAVRLEPYFAEAHNNLGVVLVDNGKLDKALFHLKEALRIKPNNAEVHNNLGFNLVKKGRLDDAITHYKEALRIKPNYEEIHHNLGNALLMQGKLDDAITHYNEALLKNTNNAEIYGSLGNALLRQDKIDDAITNYKEALRVNTNYAEVHNNLGVALIRQKKFDMAIFHCKESIRINPDKAEAHFNLGDALLRQNKMSEAVGPFARAIKIKPNYVEAHVNLGTVLFGLGRLDESIAHFSEALRSNPNFAEDHNYLGYTPAMKSNLNEAITHFNETIRPEQYLAEAHNNLGIALTRQEKFDKAVFHWKESIRTNPDNAEAYYNLGNAYLSQNKMLEAIEYFSGAIKIEPDYVKAHVNLGVVLYGLGRLDESIAHFSEALRANPNFAKAHNNLGLALSTKGNLNEAITHFKEALRIKPDFKEANHNLGVALKKAAKNEKLLNIQELRD